MSIQFILFGFFATALVISALTVVSTRYPVRSILSLVAAFVSAACLWVMQGAEFLGLALIFVYVGAVMTLFLFVVMMLNQERLSAAQVKKTALIAAPILAISLLSVLIYPGMPGATATHQVILTGSNSKALGSLLYRNYVVELELAAFILLVGMVAEIGLTFRGKRSGNKAVSADQQIKVSAKDRLHFAQFKDQS